MTPDAKERKKQLDAANKKRRYRALVNLTGDAKFARKVRGWSDQRIKDVYDINIPKRTPALKPRSTTIQTSYRKRITESAKTYTTKDRRREDDIYLPSKPKAKPEVVKRKLKEEPTFIVPASKVDDQPNVFKHRVKRGQSRKALWKKWSRKNNKLMPRDVKSKAYRINREAGLDENARYGFFIVYKAFMTKDAINIWKTRYAPDFAYEGDIYERVYKIK
jgi:hypothetical protein